MSTINYTYNVIVDRFRQFAAGHFQLRRFTHGEISQADLEKEAEWPWLHVKPRAINYAPGTRSFQFEIFISDLPRDKEDKTGYQAESITDCSLIFQDLINEIYLGNMFGTDVVLTRPVSSEPFVEQYTHTLTGVTGTIELNLDYDWSACSIPASWNYNTPTDSPSDGWGALQFIESLDQNGVFVSLLNDEETPGNSYYYGTDESGVKGWHAIVDNIGLTCETLPECATIISILEDIEALQTDVALKANTADLGATAFSNDYNDLDNLPTIPPAQVNSDWNATSGVAEILNKPTIPSIAGLVPETRTLTINGTTQDLSADRTFTIATGLTVGTTPITSGTVGRVLFEGTGNVLQESANFFWDNTNARLGIGTASPQGFLDVVGSRVTARFLTTGSLSLIGTDQTAAAQTILTLSTGVGNATGPNIILSKARGQSNDAITTSDILGTIQFQGANGSASVESSRIQSIATGLFSSTSRPADLAFFTTASGSTTTTERARIFANGNLGIGTTTDAGFKLDVNGTARFKGASNVGTTTALTVINSDSTTLLQVQDNGYIRIGSQATSAFRIYSTDASGDAEPSGLHLVLNSRVVAQAQSGNVGMVMVNGINGTITTGNQNVFLISKGFAPTSGTGTYAASLITPTINQTGGANGITRGLYVNPTLTSAADFRAIETARGNIVFGNLPTSSAGLPTGAVWNDAGTLKIV
jgi:hypothetical protein